ncbi:MAG: hypothetical protein KFF45_07930 [Thioalkalivibrio sp.]|nr:hypothetical protein [Thioalkalivibrio sp.]
MWVFTYEDLQDMLCSRAVGDETILLAMRGALPRASRWLALGLFRLEYES